MHPWRGESSRCHEPSKAAQTPLHTTSAEGDSTPEGDTALSILRLLAAVPSPGDAGQSGETDTKEHHGGRLGHQ